MGNENECSEMQGAAALLPQCFAFLLLEGFSHFAFSCAVEPLRLANLAAGRSLYRWQTISADGRSARSSFGMLVEVDGQLNSIGKDDILVIVGDFATVTSDRNAIVSFLRRERVHGRRLIAICDGVVFLAEAGLVDGMNCSVHWRVSTGFAELFPKVRTCNTAFELGDIPTASGGTAVADLQLAKMRQDHGCELASAVANLMVYHSVRSEGGSQTSAPLYKIPGRNLKLAGIVRLMESNIECPLSLHDLARISGISARQIERLFCRYLHTSPGKYYMRLRLNRARDLLTQTSVTVTQAAVASGFVCSSHFARSFKAMFGIPPGRVELPSLGPENLNTTVPRGAFTGRSSESHF